ncbi:MAG TPA: N-formylglutamate deformylase [Dongiaceae bacterium]|nr:N-formylglutamate deformylase [Dongiaceae bacterium]
MRIEHPYEFLQGDTPLLISMPHPGLLLPHQVEQLLTPEAKTLPDTDRHLPQLYAFASKLGASLLMARYSRFAIDLNRPEDDKPLYQSATTGLFPETLFDGTSIFLPGAARDDEIKTDCKERIWRLYHGRLMAELNRIKGEFSYAVLLDAHSIRGEIPRLFDGLLPDFNIGTNDGKSCALSLSASVVKACDAPGYRHILNGRFKGGHITRHYGQPDRAFHAVQLELAQRTYMNEQAPFDYRPDLAEQVQPVLQQLVQTMIDWRP